jgi:hypothetical protein
MRRHPGEDGLAIVNAYQTLRGECDVQLRCYYADKLQEIKGGMIELMKTKMTYQQNEIQDGDIICYQVDMSEKE